MCNPRIKFGALLSWAEGIGAARLATGHYADIRWDSTGRYRIFKSADIHNDQSYFLSRLTQAQLAKACFPLAALTKDTVRAIAGRAGLASVSGGESQDVCFIRSGAYPQFIAAQTGRAPEPGLIETTAGQVVGRHLGLHGFTVGQRRGLNCPAAEPYYVVRLDRERNRLIVGHKNEILTAQCRVVQINWIGRPTTGRSLSAVPDCWAEPHCYTPPKKW